MPVPDIQSFMLPLLRRTLDGGVHSLASFRAHLADDMGLAQPDVAGDMVPSGSHTRYENRIYWAATYLHRAGCVERVGRGAFRITARGKDILSSRPAKITVKLLNQFPEFTAFHEVNKSRVYAGVVAGMR